MDRRRKTMERGEKNGIALEEECRKYDRIRAISASRFFFGIDAESVRSRLTGAERSQARQEEKGSDTQ